MKYLVAVPEIRIFEQTVYPENDGEEERKLREFRRFALNDYLHADGIYGGGAWLCRWILDNPDEVRGKKVIDIASGSGAVAIAAAKAGAAHVKAVDIDPKAVEFIRRNAAANGVTVEAVRANAAFNRGIYDGADVVTAADFYYKEGWGRDQLLITLLELASKAYKTLLVASWLEKPGPLMNLGEKLLLPIKSKERPSLLRKIAIKSPGVT